MKKPIPFPTQTAPGAKPQEAGGRIINGYVEELGASAPNKTVVRRGPGLVNFGTTTQTGFRGAIEVAGTQYVAVGSKIFSLTSAGGAGTALTNSLVGTKKMFFARNNNATPDKWCVDPDGNIAVFTTTTVTNVWPDANLPAVNGTCVIDGYGVFTTAAGKFYATGINATSVSSLSFGSAEAKPDGLVRPVAWGTMLLLFGTQTTEIWTDQGLTPFPFGRAHVIPRGIAGPYCVSGFEDGFTRGPIFVGDDNCVYSLTGYTINKVSTADIDGLIEGVADKTTLEASSYISRGHAFWQLTCPAWTWVLDITTSQWFQRDSYLTVNSRITQAYQSFGKWLCGDTLTGNIQQITSTAYDEVGSSLRLRIESGPVMDFPSGASVGRADFFFATGVGNAAGVDPIATNPTVEISWSDDDGFTWSVPILRKLGRQSSPEQMISLTSCTGRTSSIGRRWRLDISDPVYASFMFATQSDNPRV